MTQRQEVSKYYWKNGSGRLSGCSVVTNLSICKKKTKKTRKNALSVLKNEEQ